MRLIDADELVEIVNCTFSKPPFSRKTMLNMIEMARTYEPKKGKWYDWNFTAFDGCTVWHRACSVCGYKRDDDNLDKDTNYCPNCGARMERNEDDQA